jgi:5-methyltetrahydropteroyltriglutamate--homocysteine methyltransferase
MYKASSGITLPTSIIGSLPRPSWYTAGLGSQSFLEAMMNLRYREQYEDAVSVYLRAQETAGLDICTDGDAHFDEQISGMSWQSYPLTHMAGFSAVAEPSAYQLATGAPRGHILHDFLEARVLPKIVGPVGPGNLQYAAMWKVAQRLTRKPVKFGTIFRNCSRPQSTTDTTRIQSNGSGRSATRSTASSANWPMPAAR